MKSECFLKLSNFTMHAWLWMVCVSSCSWARFPMYFLIVWHAVHCQKQFLIQYMNMQLTFLLACSTASWPVPICHTNSGAILPLWKQCVGLITNVLNFIRRDCVIDAYNPIRYPQTAVWVIAFCISFSLPLKCLSQFFQWAVCMM